MFSICTAGHINHGKTTLVKELTGVDTDRLKQEKERGISIELGFAKYIIDEQNYASFIDSPGHENFIKNMIAGTFAVDLVILVIAANEGVKEQTVEHLEIIKSLDVKNLIVVHNKIDLIKDDEISSKKNSISDIYEKFISDKHILKSDIQLASRDYIKKTRKVKINNIETSIENYFLFYKFVY